MASAAPVQNQNKVKLDQVTSYPLEVGIYLHYDGPDMIAFHSCNLHRLTSLIVSNCLSTSRLNTMRQCKVLYLRFL